MSQQTIAQDLTATSSTPVAKVGQIHTDEYGGVFRYGLSNGAHTVGQVASIGGTVDYTPLTTTTSGVQPQEVGIAMTGIADNEYGWFAIGPFPTESGVSVSALTLAAADVKLYTTATAGSVDDTATDLIAGLALNSTVGGSTAVTACRASQRLVVNCQD